MPTLWPAFKMLLGNGYFATDKSPLLYSIIRQSRIMIYKLAIERYKGVIHHKKGELKSKLEKHSKKVIQKKIYLN